MKKIFLFTLLSVLFSTTFCQTSTSGTEIITRITINKNIDEKEFQDIERLSGFYWNLYKWVISDVLPGGQSVKCYGLGIASCFVFFEVPINFRGISPEAAQSTCNNLIQESDERVLNGEYRGSLTRKVEISETQSFILYQINWNYDPEKPYNGNAEIIISKTDNFGF